MSRAKPRRPGTKGGGARRLPSDLPDAVESALDDMMTQALQTDPLDEDSLMTQALLKDEPADVTRPKVPLPGVRQTPPTRPTPPPTPAAASRSTASPPPAASHRSPSPGTTPPPAAPHRSPSPGTPPPPAASHRSPPPGTTPPPAASHRSPGTTPPPISPHRTPPPRTTPPPIPASLDESTVDGGAALRDDDAVQPHAVPGEQFARADSEVSTGSALRVVVFEEPAHLGSVQSAIAAAGHQVVAGASGRDGIKRIIETLRSTSVDVVLVTLPSGEAVVDAALALEPRRPVVIASVEGNPVAAVQRAVSATADLVALRPHDVSTLAPLLLAAARLTIERRVTASARGAEQVLRARLDELADPEPRGLLPFEMFQRVLELEIKRAKRFDYALSIALFAVDVVPASPPPGIRGILRARAGNALIHTVRDIDIATQLDHERFLVLLPYTDLKGASGLAQRVITAVASGDPVTAAGRPYSPKVVGAVAGGNVGQPISFAKLMKDAARALDEARRDGADLAVQP